MGNWLQNLYTTYQVNINHNLKLSSLHIESFISKPTDIKLFLTILPQDKINWPEVVRVEDDFILKCNKHCYIIDDDMMDAIKPWKYVAQSQFSTLPNKIKFTYF